VSEMVDNLQLWPDYDKTKDHGNRPTSAKCQYFWGMNELCFHQIMEIMDGGMTRKGILARDFKKKEAEE